MLSLYMMMLGIGQVIFGPFSDKVGWRPISLADATTFVIASLGVAWSSTAPVFVTLRLPQAMDASAMLVATFTVVRNIYASRPEGVVVCGLFNSVLTLMPALGPIAGALTGGFLGWQAVFTILAVLAMLTLLNAGFRWHEAHPLDQVRTRRSVLPIFASPAFWVYTVDFSAGIGTFSVFFSTAPRVLIDQAEYSEIGFSFTFTTVTLVMIMATRLAKSFVVGWGIAGCVARGMALLVCGAVLLGIGEPHGSPSFLTLTLPMWVVVTSVVFTVPVTTNGALAELDDIVGSAVAFYPCAQNLIVSIVGTLAVTLLNGDTAWSVICYTAAMAALISLGLVLLRPYGTVTEKSPVVQPTTGSRPAPMRRTSHRNLVSVSILSGRIPFVPLVQFIAVAEHLNFRHAVKALSISRSSVGARVKALEDNLGIPLFERHTRDVRLADAGRHFMERVTAGVDQLNHAVKTVG